MIDREQIKVHGGHLALGQQSKNNHRDCKAGVDTKSRLYVKRVVGGLVAFCHHCQEPGFVRDLDTDGTNLRRWLFDKDSDTPRVFRSPYLELSDKRFKVKDPVILNWLYKHHIKPLTNPPDAHYFQELPNQQLCLSINNNMGHTSGYQLRSFSGGPKYTTYYAEAYASDVAWFPAAGSTIFITEDYASAYRIWRDTSHTTIALLKTTMSNATALTLTGVKNAKFVIWLDADDAGDKGARKIEERLRYLCLPGQTVMRVTSPLEPKELTVKELRSQINSITI